MTRSPNLDNPEKIAEPLNLDGEEGVRSPGLASAPARRGSNRIWLALIAAVAVIFGIAIVGAASRNDDRGIRGPADQAAPDAPKNEKMRPSTGR